MIISIMGSHTTWTTLMCLMFL